MTAQCPAKTKCLIQTRPGMNQSPLVDRAQSPRTTMTRRHASGNDHNPERAVCRTAVGNSPKSRGMMLLLPGLQVVRRARDP